MRNIILMVAGAVGAIILGFVYIFGAFGPIDIAVVWWGQVSVGLGIALGILALIGGAKRTRLPLLILGLGYAVLVVLQIPPVILWFAYHGSGIEREGPFVAHWGYAIPHIILLAISAFTLYSILRTLRIASLRSGADKRS